MANFVTLDELLSKIDEYKENHPDVYSKQCKLKIKGHNDYMEYVCPVSFASSDKITVGDISIVVISNHLKDTGQLTLSDLIGQLVRIDLSSSEELICLRIFDIENSIEREAISVFPEKIEFEQTQDTVFIVAERRNIK